MPQLKSNTEWKQWGKDDPLWAVATKAGKQKDGASPWTNADFYALGASDWKDFLSQWQQYGFNPASCLEIGCGAGRYTKALAGTFDLVYGVDVSQDMIDYAQNTMTGAGIENVSFTLIDGLNLPPMEGKVKCVFSTHVIQHLDNVEAGFSYFREIHRILDTDGTFMIHLPLYQYPREQGAFGSLFGKVNRLHIVLTDVLANWKRRKGAGVMRFTSYSLSALHTFLAELGFKNIEFRFFETASNGELHPCVLATK